MSRYTFNGQGISPEVNRYLKGHKITGTKALRQHLARSTGKHSIGAKMERNLRALLK